VTGSLSCRSVPSRRGARSGRDPSQKSAVPSANSRSTAITRSARRSPALAAIGAATCGWVLSPVAVGATGGGTDADGGDGRASDQLMVLRSDEAVPATPPPTMLQSNFGRSAHAPADAVFHSLVAGHAAMVAPTNVEPAEAASWSLAEPSAAPDTAKRRAAIEA